jgi:hypothetical protein
MNLSVSSYSLCMKRKILKHYMEVCLYVCPPFMNPKVACSNTDLCMDVCVCLCQCQFLTHSYTVLKSGVLPWDIPPSK